MPQRFVLVLMLFICFAIEYMSRNVLSIAITEIAKKTYSNETIISGDICPASDDNSTDDSGNVEKGIYEWSESLQGVILSSFYWGYLPTQIPGGLLVQKFGGKHTLLVGMFLTTLFTALTPLSITASSSGAELLIILRVLLGLSQGVIYACIHGLMAAWIPLRERTSAGAIVFSGIQIGSILATYLSGFLLQKIDGWAAPFYIYGIIGLVWCIFFVS